MSERAGRLLRSSDAHTTHLSPCTSSSIPVRIYTGYTPGRPMYVPQSPGPYIQAISPGCPPIRPAVPMFVYTGYISRSSSRPFPAGRGQSDAAFLPGRGGRLKAPSPYTTHGVHLHIYGASPGPPPVLPPAPPPTEARPARHPAPAPASRRGSMPEN